MMKVLYRNWLFVAATAALLALTYTGCSGTVCDGGMCQNGVCQ
jgi:hypothetical protein